MKIGRYQKNDTSFHGELVGELIYPLQGELHNLTRVPGAAPVNIAEVKILAPVTPSKLIALGPGHTDMIPPGKQAPERPWLFSKPSTTLANPGDPIIFPPELDNILYELEIAVVIGKTAHRISREQAAEHILGYTCCNDVTAGFLDKDWGTQKSYHWKAYDTFGPLGPVVDTDHNIAGRAMISRINGKVHASTVVSLIYAPDDIVSWISHIMTLNPGDVISMGAAAQANLKPGDVVEIEVAGIGVLRNPVVAIA